MSEEQKEKWYNAFTREQLVERCEYLQRSCERKEEQITDLDSENFDLENEIEKLNKQIEEYQKALDEITSEKIDLENIIKEVREKIECIQILGLKSGKTLITTLLNDILKIINKEEE